MKERPILFSSPMVRAILDGRKTQTRRIMKIQPDGRGTRCTNVHFEDWHGRELKCPYGWVSDILWVRETFIITHSVDDKDHYEYKADYTEIMADDIGWKPSIYMPKDACRIRLQITDIRIEKIQDISKEDVIAEGIDTKFLYEGTHPKWAYFSLWDKINGKGSCEQNPWVWVIEFKKL